MASAFDEIQASDAEYIRTRLLAGDTMAELRRGIEGISIKQMRAMRDEVFEPLLSDPEAVKKLANGKVLNALNIIRYRMRPGRKARMARPSPVQIEMFQS